ncbi:MAG: bifunctional adenosylcobinamide kinase/adenosylcobinamide-phosphate guanylyltransferase [Candidatus Ventricola sp.]|nr:bifunctional adenosylcobinamide kinase/adenosylcobinamide-phosphate guanylyltransferase [Candidatus Ventricola sp.]
MKLYIGGAYQGQLELARAENPDALILEDFHEAVQEAMQRGEDARAFAQSVIAAHPDAVIVANEVGAGVVPIEAQERAFREAVGRALCIIAQAAQQVTRVICGIGVRIK